jgi:glycosyltransferase involved in cell wall biosynthesis
MGNPPWRKYEPGYFSNPSVASDSEGIYQSSRALPKMRILALFPSLTEDWAILDRLAGETNLSILIDHTVSPLFSTNAGYRLTHWDGADLTAAFGDELQTVRPDFLLWFEDLHTFRSWRCWNVLRKKSPDTLVSLVLTKPFPSLSFLANRLLRLGLSFRVIDHVLIGQANLNFGKRRGIEPQRMATVDSNRAQDVAELLRQRLNGEKKSVLWVDQSVTSGSPSMRGLVESLSSLRARGWNIRALCYELQKIHPPLEATRLPKLPAPAFLETLQFFVACNIYRFIQSVILRKRPARIIHATCCTDLQADICAIHFCHRRWLQIAKTAKSPWFRDWIALQMSHLFALLEQWHLRRDSVKLLLPVSRAVGDLARQCYGAHAEQKVLPNSFDQSRFNPTTRELHRVSARNALGFSANETVLAFTSYGHYRRKGFWLIVSALQILAEEGAQDVRLLVIGGTAKTLARLKGELATRFPEYGRWILFAGTTSEVEKFLAAADAYLYPSYFEAFSLAEIEAAAMGLPLLVTRHPGTEMIVREGKNGVWLEFDARDIAKKIQAFARREFSFELPNVGEALTKSQYADRLLSIYDDFLRQSSRTESFVT